MEILSVLQETLYCEAVVGSLTVKLTVRLRSGHPQKVMLLSRRAPGAGSQAVLLDTQATLIDVARECAHIASVFSEMASELHKRSEAA